MSRAVLQTALFFSSKNAFWHFFTKKKPHGKQPLNPHHKATNGACTCRLLSLYYQDKERRLRRLELLRSYMLSAAFAAMLTQHSRAPLRSAWARPRGGAGVSARAATPPPLLRRLAPLALPYRRAVTVVARYRGHYYKLRHGYAMAARRLTPPCPAAASPP